MYKEKGVACSYSAGKNEPSIKIPENACDCHLHIYDPVRFPYQLGLDVGHPPATVDDYRKLLSRLHIQRCVIVTPSIYGTDNRATIDGLKQMGDTARAVVVLDEKDVTDEILSDMNSAGVRGVRYFIAEGRQPDMRSIGRMAEKIAPLGWHLDFWMSAELTVGMEEFLNKLPCRIVFDHRGHLPCDQGIHHPAFSVIKGLMEQKKAWVKLSALYHDSSCRGSGFKDTIEVGKAYVHVSPDQVIWGSDWPHPSELNAESGYPNDADLLDALYEQAGPDENVKKILVNNPYELYGFPERDFQM